MKKIVEKLTFSNRKIIVDILAIFFGIGSWIGINAMFVQLPLLVKSAPEEWALPSYMSVTVQIANLGPIIYALFRKYFAKYLNDTYWIASLLFLGAASAILMSFFHDHISYIGGNEHSTVFLILVFFTAIVGCTSSVLFFPYMRYYKEIYLISYFIGEGLSGFIPSIVALIQGIGGNPECVESVGPVYKDPRFSTQVFYIIIFFICMLSFSGFLFLTNLKVCKREKVMDTKIDTANSKNHKYQMSSINQDMENSVEIVKCNDNHSVSTDVSNYGDSISIVKSTNLLLLICVVNAFANGVFPSIQSYSCLPYGNVAYHLAVTLGSMANPVACFLAIFLPRTSNTAIVILTSICSVFVAYVLATSLLSPSPPLANEVAGVVIIVLSWIIVIGLVTYIKLCISTIFRTKGGTWMFYCGAVSQLGSAIGSLISFALINYTGIFVPLIPCQ